MPTCTEESKARSPAACGYSRSKWPETSAITTAGTECQPQSTWFVLLPPSLLIVVIAVDDAPVRALAAGGLALARRRALVLIVVAVVLEGGVPRRVLVTLRLAALRDHVVLVIRQKILVILLQDMLESAAAHSTGPKARRHGFTNLRVVILDHEAVVLVPTRGARFPRVVLLVVRGLQVGSPFLARMPTFPSSHRR
eukprot:scaffold4971_cov254-Pinguiococcus_pyrenoidosus.AAC.9